jgi:hypothetical protein
VSSVHRKNLAIIWLLIPPLLLSALIHSVDPDIGGVAGLALPAHLLSVIVWSLPLLGFVLACLATAVRRGWGGFMLLSLVLATAVAVRFVSLQTPQPAGLAGYLLPLGGLTLITWLFLAAAVIPALALGWPQRARHSHSSLSMNHYDR